jgi:hypothetical protein
MSYKFTFIRHGPSVISRDQHDKGQTDSRVSEQGRILNVTPDLVT